MPRRAEDSSIAHISTPPPTPHALALTIIILNLFPPTTIPQDKVDRWFSKNSEYVQKTLQMLAKEIYYPSEPSTYIQLQRSMHRVTQLAPNQEDPYVRRAVEQLGQMPQIFNDIQHSFEVIDSIPNTCWETPDENHTMSENRITYHSPLGIFLRKVHLSYRVLNFPQSLIIREDVLAWCAGDPEIPAGASAGSSNLLKKEKDSRIPDSETETQSSGEGGLAPGFSAKKGKRNIIANKVTEMDDLLETRLMVLQEYQSACKRGDYSLALSSLEKFYSYRFPPNDKMRHHHALLQLASFHYATGGLELAKNSVEEAVRGARSAGDVQCLKHCTSLLKRLTAETQPAMTTVMTPGQAPHVDDVGEDGITETPLDELWTVKQRLDLGETVPAAYTRILRATGRQNAIIKAKAGPRPAVNGGIVEPETENEIKDKRIPQSSMLDDAMSFSVQAAVWEMLGSPSVASLNEDLALRASTSRPDVDLTIVIAKSKRYMRASRAEEALAVLLIPHFQHDLNIDQYHKWSEAVWDIVEHDAVRREDQAVLDYIRSYRLPVHSYRQKGVGGPLRMLHDPSEKITHDFFDRDELDVPRRGVDVLSGLMKRAEEAEAHNDAPFAALPHLLKASHIASTLKHQAIYRAATVRLADVISRLDGSMNPFREPGEKRESMLVVAVQQLEPLWGQILRSDDDETTWTASNIMLLYANEQGSRDRYEEYARIALRSAYRLGSRRRMTKTLMAMAMFEDKLGNEDRRDVFADLWDQLDTGSDIQVVAGRFDWVRDTSTSSLGMTKEDSVRMQEGKVKFDLPFARQIRDIVLYAGVAIASAP